MLCYHCHRTYVWIHSSRTLRRKVVSGSMCFKNSVICLVLLMLTLITGYYTIVARMRRRTLSNLCLCYNTIDRYDAKCSLGTIKSERTLESQMLEPMAMHSWKLHINVLSLMHLIFICRCSAKKSKALCKPLNEVLLFIIKNIQNIT